MGVCFVVHAGLLTSITGPGLQLFKALCKHPIRNFPVARLLFLTFNSRLLFSRVIILQWLSSQPSPGHPVQSLLSLLRLDGLRRSSHLFNKSLRRSVLLKRPVAMFERFRPHPPVYLFPVFLFVTGWFGSPLRPAVVNMLLWPRLVLPVRADPTSNLSYPLSKQRKLTFHPPVRFIVMLLQFIVFSLFIVSLFIVSCVYFHLTYSLFIHLRSHRHCSFMLVHCSHSRLTF